MSAYMIVQVEVTDPDGFAEYREKVGPQIAKHGGKYLVRGAEVENLEGDWNPGRLVVFEFPSIDDIRRWYEADEYQPLLALRERTANTTLSIVEGV
ncbi:MAG: DUF1330 domain-containing protein [Chloroflexi bacterium]|jgi:uncharacterized protein (DUF1330 family)|nr:DUF1330 domain-containing protein [Chloroflexota bacterium]MBT5319455.1 DUF1330 domain-containing protein [Chloroflexota bacterium]